MTVRSVPFFDPGCSFDSNTAAVEPSYCTVLIVTANHLVSIFTLLTVTPRKVVYNYSLGKLLDHDFAPHCC